MSYERLTAEELVNKVFGSFEECIDEALTAQVPRDSEVSTPTYAVGGSLLNSPDWLSLAFWQEYYSDAPRRRAIARQNRSRARKVR